VYKGQPEEVEHSSQTSDALVCKAGLLLEITHWYSAKIALFGPHEQAQANNGDQMKTLLHRYIISISEVCVKRL